MASFSTTILIVLVHMLETQSEDTCHCPDKGTVVPADPFNATADAHALLNILTISGARIRDLVNLLTKRSCSQRAAIKREFELKYGPLDNLMPEAQDSGWYTIVQCSFMCEATLAAFQADFALGGDEVDITLISDIMIYCSQTAEMHDRCLSEYQNIYNQELKRIIEINTGNDFRDVMLSAIKRRRGEVSTSEPHYVEIAARNLVAERHSWTNRRHWLDEVLMSLSLEGSLQVLQKFSELNEDISVGEEINNHLEGKKQTFYSMLYTFIVDKIEYYTNRFWNAIGVTNPSLMTDVILLIRTVLITSDVNAVQVSKLFEQTTQESLKQKLEYDLYGNAGEETTHLIFAYLNISHYYEEEKFQKESSLVKS